MTIKQCFTWWSFVNRGVAGKLLLASAAHMGYHGVELIEPAHWQEARDNGLAIATMRGHESIEDGLNRRENLPRIRSEIEHNVALAVKWGIPILICFSGNRTGLHDDAGVDIVAENLSAVADLAKAGGVTLALELLNSKVDHPGYQCDHTPWAVRVVEKVNSPHVRVLYDIYHAQIMEGDVIRTIGERHGLFAHYHTGGNPGRHEIDDTQELNYRAIFRAIRDTGYDGYIGHEFIPKGNPVEALKHAFDLCAANVSSG